MRADGAQLYAPCADDEVADGRLPLGARNRVIGKPARRVEGEWWWWWKGGGGGDGG